MFLTTAFRPRFTPPAFVVGVARQDNDNGVISLYLDVEASPDERLLEKLLSILHDEGYPINGDGVKQYMSKLQDTLREIREGVDPIKAFKRSLTEVLGATDISASLASVKRWSTFKHYVKALETLFSKKERLKGIRVYLVTTYRAGDSRDAQRVGHETAVVVAKRARLTIFTGKRRRGKIPSVLTLHPRLGFIPGVFETIYEKRALEGYLPGEKEAARILSGYIRGVEGFEVIKGRLSLKIGPRRLSIYRLSDGHRMASLLAFLYAVAKPPLLLLVDTPEAFLYPDGVQVAAELLAKLAAERGVQVIVATQSSEMLQELLDAAKENGVLDETLVHRLHIRRRERSIEAKATWPGRLGLYAIEGLEADLRR